MAPALCVVAQMKKASAYRGHAEDCRRLARGLRGAERDQLAALADMWETFATECDRREAGLRAILADVAPG